MRPAGVRVSAHAPAVGSATNRMRLVRRGMRQDYAVGIWSALTLIVDEVTQAKAGEIVLTAVMLHAKSPVAGRGIRQGGGAARVMLEQRFFAPLEYRADSKAGRVSGVAMALRRRLRLIGEPCSGRSLSLERSAMCPRLDVIARLQHDRGRPIGRTGGGGLELTDSAAELRAELLLPDHPGRCARTQPSCCGLRILQRLVVLSFKATARALRRQRTRYRESRAKRGLGLVDQPAFDDSLATIAKRFEQSAPTPHARRPTASTLWL